METNSSSRLDIILLFAVFFTTNLIESGMTLMFVKK